MSSKDCKYRCPSVWIRCESCLKKTGRIFSFCATHGKCQNCARQREVRFDTKVEELPITLIGERTTGRPNPDPLAVRRCMSSLHTTTTPHAGISKCAFCRKDICVGCKSRHTSVCQHR